MSGRTVMVGCALAMLALACSAPPAPVVEAQPQAALPEREPVKAAGHDHAAGEDHHHHPQPQAAAEPGLVRIADPGNVCMLSNRYLGEKQHVPVEVEGKTYFGCCAGCAGKLGQTASARVAVDPVSGKTIDKGSAVLARDERGKVLYFESEETFAQAKAAGR